MRRSCCNLILAAGLSGLLFQFGVSNASGETYHVDPTAPAQGDGSLDSPFRNWDEIPFSEGSEYLQRRGTVAIGTIAVHYRARAAAPIRIGAYGEGPEPILEGEIIIVSAAYITVEDFRVRNSEGPGVQILTDGHHITLQRLHVYHCVSGISISEDAGASNLITECVIYENDSSGIAIAGGATAAGSETTIQGNTIYRNGLHGVQIVGNYYIVEENEIHNNGLSGVPGTSGVHLYSPGPDQPSADFNIIRNNRISNQSDFDGFDGNGIQADHYCDNNEIYGNEIFQNDGGGVFIHDSRACVVRENVLYGNVRDRGDTREERGEIDITSKSAEIDRAADNVVTDNIVIAVNPAATPIFIDSEASDDPNPFGRNALYHEGAGDLWKVASQAGSDLNVWNTFAAGEGEDFLLDPDAAGFTTPVPPPDYMLDDSFVVHTAVFTTSVPDQVNVLIGSPGPDSFTGGNLDDTLAGNGDDDILDGADGNDWLVGGFGNDLLIGGNGADFLLGGYGNDVADGGDGNDDISTGSGDDVALGGAGDDRLIGSAGEDDLDGGDGDDTVIGGDGNDRLSGGAGNDLVLGEAGDDLLDESSDPSGHNSLFGEDGNDIILGGVGDDRIVGGPGIDEGRGGPGDDSLDESGDDSPNFLYGDAGDDIIFGGDADDLIDGGDGNDVVDGGDGEDDIDGGPGEDVIGGGAGDDYIEAGDGHDRIDESADTDSPNTILGGPGNDVIVTGAAGGFASGEAGNDIVSGGPGPDIIDERSDSGGQNILDGGGGPDEIYGGDGPDSIGGGEGDDSIDGGRGDDQIEGGSGNDVLVGGPGFDVIVGGTGDDTIDESNDTNGSVGNLLFGGDGNDFIRGGAGGEQLYGEAGRDDVDGGAGNDSIFGGSEGDTIRGSAGNDFIVGGSGDDVLDGDDGSDLISAGFGDDVIRGGDGDDAIDGESGDDWVDGGSGDDVVVGGPGNDQLQGGPGVDNFTFEPGSGVDVIADFESADVLVVAQNLNGLDIGDDDDLLARMSQEGPDTYVDLGDGNSVRLLGFELIAMSVDNVLVRETDPTPAVPRILFVLSSMQAASDTSVVVPVFVVDGTDITSISFSLWFDSDILEFESYTRGSLLAEWDDVSVVTTGDRIRVEASGRTELMSGGPLVELKFHVTPAPPAVVGSITFLEAEANNSTVPLTWVDGSVLVQDKVFLDVNGDESVDAADLQLVINEILGIETSEESTLNHPDVDGSGVVDAVDVQLLVNALLAQ